MKLLDAQKRWNTVEPLRYHFSDKVDKQIWDIFYAPFDPILARYCYTSWLNGVHFPLYLEEQNNRFVWIAFRDRSITKLDELLEDEKLTKVLDSGGIDPIELTFEDQWSQYVDLYRGFGIEMKYNNKPFVYEISDDEGNLKYERRVEENWKDSIYMPYFDSSYDLSKMKKPRIRFKAPDFKTVEVTLLFDVRS
jgi:hypothetical protein